MTHIPSPTSPNLNPVGTSRCDVPGGKAGGMWRPLGARTAQRAVPAKFEDPLPVQFGKWELPPATSASKRLVREWRTMAAMIRCYCHGCHGAAAALCPECQGLLDYATLRLDRCRFGADKPTCANCPVHCYQRDRREQMKAVMRHAGPRMLWRHPVLSLRHWLDGFRKAPALRNEVTPSGNNRPQRQTDEDVLLGRRRGDESQNSSKSIGLGPPHVGSYDFNELPTIKT